MQIAIMGFGNMGLTHQARYANLGVTVVVIDISAEKRKLAESMHIKTYESLEACMAEQQVDGIDICTPTQMHLSHLQSAMTYNKPIMISWLKLSNIILDYKHS